MRDFIRICMDKYAQACIKNPKTLYKTYQKERANKKTKKRIKKA